MYNEELNSIITKQKQKNSFINNIKEFVSIVTNIIVRDSVIISKEESD